MPNAPLCRASVVADAEAESSTAKAATANLLLKTRNLLIFFLLNGGASRLNGGAGHCGSAAGWPRSVAAVWRVADVLAKAGSDKSVASPMGRAATRRDASPHLLAPDLARISSYSPPTNQLTNHIMNQINQNESDTCAVRALFGKSSHGTHGPPVVAVVVAPVEVARIEVEFPREVRIV